jgi:hypothetical protein
MWHCRISISISGSRRKSRQKWRDDLEQLKEQLDALIEEFKQLQEYGKRLEGETRKKGRKM